MAREEKNKPQNPRLGGEPEVNCFAGAEQLAQLIRVAQYS